MNNLSRVKYKILPKNNNKMNSINKRMKNMNKDNNNNKEMNKISNKYRNN